MTFYDSWIARCALDKGTVGGAHKVKTCFGISSDALQLFAYHVS